MFTINPDTGYYQGPVYEEDGRIFYNNCSLVAILNFLLETDLPAFFAQGLNNYLKAYAVGPGEDSYLDYETYPDLVMEVLPGISAVSAINTTEPDILSMTNVVQLDPENMLEHRPAIIYLEQEHGPHSLVLTAQDRFADIEGILFEPDFTDFVGYLKLLDIGNFGRRFTQEDYFGNPDSRCFASSLANLFLEIGDVDTAVMAYLNSFRHPLIPKRGTVNVYTTPKLVRDLTEGRYVATYHIGKRQTFQAMIQGTLLTWNHEDVHRLDVVNTITNEYRNRNIAGPRYEHSINLPFLQFTTFDDSNLHAMGHFMVRTGSMSVINDGLVQNDVPPYNGAVSIRPNSPHARQYME